MREYQDGKEAELTGILCNCCKKKMAVEGNMVKEGICSVKVTWGYFSGKDGETHRFDLCEQCYDKLVKTFLVPVEVETENELL